MTVDMSPVIYRPSRPGPDHDRGRPTRVPIAGPEIPTAASFAQDRGPEDQAAEQASTRRPTKQRRRRLLGRRDDPDGVEPTPVQPAATAPASDAGPEPTSDPFASEAARPRRGRGVIMSPPPVGPGDPAEMGDDVPGATDTVAEEVMANAVAADTPGDPEHPVDRDTTPMVAIGGRVRSTRLRGLRGMTVTVTDETDQTVAEALTGRRGEFVIPDLPAGSYRVGARDAVDGDFSEGWHGSADAAQATWLRVDDLTSLPSIDVALTARVGIDADVTATDDQADIHIVVMDRSTGLPAVGEVIVSTEHFRATLPLTDGRTRITVLGTVSDAAEHGHELTSRVRIQYTGAEHSAPAARTLRLS